MKNRLAAVLTLGLAMTAMAGGGAIAEVPKCFSIKVVIPYAVGSATDLIFRAYTETINRRTSGPLLKVVNVTKKSVVWKGIWAKPDGCTLLATTQALVANHLANNRKPKWSRLKPVAMLTRTPLVVVARGNLKDANLPNIIEQALADPNAVGIGEARSPLERMLLMGLEDASGARFRIMTYDSGRQSYAALLAGKLDIAMVSVSAAKRRLDTRQLQALAVTTEARIAQLSGVATLKEQGIAAVFGVDRGLLAPKETPMEIVAEIADWFKKAAEDPDLVEQMGESGTQIKFLGPDAYTRYFENLTADWLEMIQRAAGQQVRRRPT